MQSDMEHANSYPADSLPSPAPVAAESSDSDGGGGTAKKPVMGPPRSRLARRRSAVTFPSTYRSLTAASQRRSRGTIYSCSSYDEACYAPAPSPSTSGAASVSNHPGADPEHRLDWIDFIGCLLHQSSGSGGGNTSKRAAFSKRGMTSTQIMIRKKLEYARPYPLLLRPRCTNSLKVCVLPVLRWHAR